MKKAILLTALFAALYNCWKSTEPIPQSIPLAPRRWPAIKNAPAESPPAAKKENFEDLREELAQVDHELARAGYPEVMLDTRLSETEREELIAKVNHSTELYTRIVRMKIAAVQRGER